MSQAQRRVIDRISDPSYLQRLASAPTEELRKMRKECEEVEAELSYTRRLLHGKLDILRHDLKRRVEGGESGINELIRRLPKILAEGAAGPSGRRVQVLVPRNAEKHRRRVERIASEASLARLDEISTSELSGMIERLAEAESQASQDRRQIQRVMDEIRAEVVRRYQDGREDPSELVS